MAAAMIMLERLAAGPSADRSLLRLRHDPHRGGAHRPQHGAGPRPHVPCRSLAAAAGRLVGSCRGKQARAAARPELPMRIIGTDVDEGVLGLARFHAEKAGVAADIHFQQRPFSELASKRPHGCVICNPPYGERLGESAEALALHRAMPDVFRRLKTWSFFILTALPDFEARHRAIGHAAAEAL